MKWTYAKPDFACLHLKKYDIFCHQIVIVFRNPIVVLKVRLAWISARMHMFPQSFTRTGIIEVRHQPSPRL